MVEFDSKQAAIAFLTPLQQVLLTVERHTPTYVGLEGLLVPRDKATPLTGPRQDGEPPGGDMTELLYIEDDGARQGEDAQLGSLAAALSAAEEADLRVLLEHLLGGSGGDMQEFVSSLQAELDALEVCCGGCCCGDW